VETIFWARETPSPQEVAAVMQVRTISLCPWCGAEPRVPVESDDSYHYVICARHQRAVLAQYAETRLLTRLARSPRRHTAERPRRAA
jgi:hypothetical protein